MLTKDFSKYSNLKVFGLLLFVFFMLIGAILLKYPLNNSLVGNIDIWLFVWQLNDFYLNIFSDAPFGQVMFPTDHLKAYIDSPLGLGLLFLPIKCLFKNDIWAFYFLTVLVLSLNSASFTLLLKQLKIKFWIAVLLGFFLSTNNYVLSQLENYNAYAFFPAILGCLYLIKAKRKKVYLWLSAFFFGFQIYYSIYLFCFQWIVIVPILLWKGWIKMPKKFFLLSCIIILIVLPFVISHQHSPTNIDRTTLSKTLLEHDNYSIHFFKDFGRVNSGNILYKFQEKLSNPWQQNARSAFFGYITYLLFFMAIFYLVKNWKRAYFYVFLILFCSVVISLGPFIEIGSNHVKTPIGWLNTLFPQTSLLRHLFRTHFITIAVMLLCIGLFLSKVILSQQLKIVVVIFLLFFFCLENIPFKAQLFKSYENLNKTKELSQLTKGIGEHKNLLFLPNCSMVIFDQEFKDEINPIAREYIYMVWKNNIPHNIFNGRMAYLSGEGLFLNQKTCLLDQESYQEMVNWNLIDYIIISNDFASEQFLNRVDKIIYSNSSIINSTKSFVLVNPNSI